MKNLTKRERGKLIRKMLKINDKQELYQFGDFLIELEEKFGEEKFQHLNEFYCSEYERLVLCGYSFKPNYLHN